MFQLWGGRGEAFPSGSVTALKGKVSWKLGARKYHKVTIYNKPQTRDLLGGKNSEGGCISGEKQQRTEQKTEMGGCASTYRPCPGRLVSCHYKV